MPINLEKPTGYSRKADIRVIVRKIKSFSRIFKQQGLVGVLELTSKRLKEKKHKGPVKKKIDFLVKTEDVIKANWSSRTHRYSKTHKAGPYTINWVMSPPGEGSGGHQNIFRFINYLERQGHTCKIYLYSSYHHPSVKDVKNIVSLGSYPKVSASIEWLKGGMTDADAVFATGWETAYPVFNDKGKARKCYFVQDFEPLFYPVGSDYVLAENTYKMDFFGITAGKWLSNKLSGEYNMKCISYDFAADSDRYFVTNTKKRKHIFFYARPVTSRRGFELGILTLTRVAEMLPDYEITLAGWDVSDYDIPFKYNNLKSLSLDQLNDLYNECAVALVISLTNMSLLPLELISSGVIPVVNKSPNNVQVSSNKYIHYAEPSPDAMAEEIVRITKMPNLEQYSQQASKSLRGITWDDAGKVLEDALLKEIGGNE